MSGGPTACETASVQQTRARAKPRLGVGANARDERCGRLDARDEIDALARPHERGRVVVVVDGPAVGNALDLERGGELALPAVTTRK